MIVCKDSEGNEGDPCPWGGLAGRGYGEMVGGIKRTWLCGLGVYRIREGEKVCHAGL